MQLLLVLFLLGADDTNKVVVGVHEFVPMVRQSATGYEGFDIDLWEAIAKEIGMETEYREMPLAALLDTMADPESDVHVGLAGITITETRESKFDFTHAYFDSSLKIAVRPVEDQTWHLLRFRHARALWDSVWQPAVLEIGLLLLSFILIAAHVVYFFERGTKGEAGSIDDRYWVGIWQAIYFCNVTSSTVGYGDFVARKLLGRVFVVLLIYAGIVFFANFTALLSADYTTDRIESKIYGPSDLPGRNIATKAGTHSVDVLNRLGANVVEVEHIEEAFEMLSRPTDDVVGVVFDAPVIDHRAKTHGDVLVLKDSFERQHYGIALKLNSPLREDINRALLKLKENGTYEEIYAKWFGAE